MTRAAPSTQEQLVLAGERLFAQHGLDGVSLRQIGAAVGNANNSVVQYHFGSKDQLVRAIFEYRLPALHRRRGLLIAQADPDDLRSWLDCQARAVMEQSELDEGHYAGFLAVLNHHGRSDFFEQVPEPYAGNSRAYVDHLRSLLAHLPGPLIQHRLFWAMKVIVDAAAERERMRTAGTPLLPFALDVDAVVDGLVGFLQALPSTRTRKALADLAPSAATRPLTV